MTIKDAKSISLENKIDIQGGHSVPRDPEELNVTHKFLVKNEGPSLLFPTSVRVNVPLFLVDASLFVRSYDVKITRGSGDVSTCTSLKNFDNVKRVIGQKTTTQPTPSPKDTDSDQDVVLTIGTTEAAKLASTTEWQLIVDANRRKRRSPLSRRKRSATVVNPNIYVQSCRLDPSYCQVFECELPKGLQHDEYAEVNVSLVVDKLNIPVPDGFNTFWYEVYAEVVQPKNELMQDWETGDGIGTSVTKFHLVESTGPINIWIIIGSIIGGLVLITIVVLILWKAGFFKRNKHQQVAQWKRESQRRSRYSSVPKSDGGPDKGEKD
ncbi:integrin alpha-9 [Elysia marginata]|uniref:Integrin alpha-9 n=1 Tax=Elysia marginata TaxID=1093978 RepID=A0AAV4JMD4_9GAST|nr:integrin alpha-9 [Elysia marginata]